MVAEDNLTLEGGPTMQHADHISENCILEFYILLLTNVTQ